MPFMVYLTALEALVARWRNEAEELRAVKRGHEMSSDEALSVAAQLEECADQLETTYTDRKTWSS